jgi:hypothetical protein
LAQRQLAADAPATDYALTVAASRVVQTFLLGDGVWLLAEPSMEDLPEIAVVTAQLKALSDDPGRRHGGEAEIIVLAAGAAAADGRKHVLLANDGGASIVAHRYGIATRHIGDVLNEFACADLEFKPDQCLTAYTQAARVSCLPAQVRPSGAEAFMCAKVAGACVACDQLERGGS